MVLFALVLGLFLVPFAGMTLEAETPTSGMGEVVPSAVPAKSTAKLAIQRVRPIAVIAGTGFKSGEIVRFTGVNAKRVRASARGTFTIRLRNVDPCDGLSVTAIGSKGSRASANYSQLLCVAP